MTQDAFATSSELSSVRARRAHLHRACQDLETALAGPLTGRSGEWIGQVAPAVARLRDAFAAHVSATEGRGGLFDQIRTDAPRLVTVVGRLRREHREIAADLAAAEGQLETSGGVAVEAARKQLTVTLARLIRHRQRGADLLYEAYEVDLGGE